MNTISFRHRITDEPIALVRLASDEGAVLHLVRCQHEPDAPDGVVLEDRAICSRWAREHVVQVLSKANAPVKWHFSRDCQRWRGKGGSGGRSGSPRVKAGSSPCHIPIEQNA